MMMSTHKAISRPQIIFLFAALFRANWRLTISNFSEMAFTSSGFDSTTVSPNKTLTGGLCLQTLDTWTGLIGSDAVSFSGNDAEIYFEEDLFDAFAEKLAGLDIHYVHPVKEHNWGQRVVRIYDPDRHIIEVGENLQAVCRRFLNSGMTPEQVSERMDVPLKFVNDWIRRARGD